MVKQPAIVLADGYLQKPNGKGAHGLVRGTDRFDILAVVDRSCAGQDAGVALDGNHRDIPVVASIADAMTYGATRPTHAIVGIATHGGRFTDEVRSWILESISNGLNIINGLHDAASEDDEIRERALAAGVELTDLRLPKPKRELHFWTGEIVNVKAPRIAILGTDCAIGKRTTARMLMQALRNNGLKAEMIYTGQTGWMQGAPHGFVLDSVANDFVSGELEHAIVGCDRELNPDVILIEGQSSLRNPSGPCGSEMLCSGLASGVVLQHAIGRDYFEGYEKEGFLVPQPADEIALIAHYGARTLAVTINTKGVEPADVMQKKRQMAEELNIPVVDPVVEGVDSLVPTLKSVLESTR
jgi:uncharacterized NAD-dependent epimerase/dehydratase family protein